MGRAWTKAEDDVLRRHMPTHGPSWDGWARLLPGRTGTAIMARKKKLGVAGPRSKARDGGRPEPASWTDEERVKLVEYALVVTKLTGHTLGECAVELARIVKAYKQQKKGHPDE